jgi:D-amino-acid dehydrogenase
MARGRARVGVIMGSQSDWATMARAASVLDELGVAHETRIVSAHRTPKRLYAYAASAARRGIKVIVAGAGGDVRFSITPMAGGIRLAGTIEFAGLDAAPNPRRHESLLGHARRVFPGLRTDGQTRWMGHRPSPPDSMPVIGRAPHFANAYFGFGHGHLGLTSAAVTGRAIADLAAGRAPPFDVAPFRADRF